MSSQSFWAACQEDGAAAIPLTVWDRLREENPSPLKPALPDAPDAPIILLSPSPTKPAAVESCAGGGKFLWQSPGEALHPPLSWTSPVGESSKPSANEAAGNMMGEEDAKKEAEEHVPVLRHSEQGKLRWNQEVEEEAHEDEEEQPTKAKDKAKGRAKAKAKAKGRAKAKAKGKAKAKAKGKGRGKGKGKIAAKDNGSGNGEEVPCQASEPKAKSRKGKGKGKGAKQEDALGCDGTEGATKTGAAAVPAVDSKSKSKGKGKSKRKTKLLEEAAPATDEPDAGPANPDGPAQDVAKAKKAPRRQALVTPEEKDSLKKPLFATVVFLHVLLVIAAMTVGMHAYVCVGQFCYGNPATLAHIQHRLLQHTANYRVEVYWTGSAPRAGLRHKTTLKSAFYYNFTSYTILIKLCNAMAA